jgi:hypothetical protein
LIEAYRQTISISNRKEEVMVRVRKSLQGSVSKIEESKISVATDGSVLLGGTEGDKNGQVQGQGEQGILFKQLGLVLGCWHPQLWAQRYRQSRWTCFIYL